MLRLFKGVSIRLQYIRWQLAVWLKGPGIASFTLPDSSVVDYPLASEVGKQLFFSSFEKDEVNYLKNTVKEGDVVLDIGANAGIYSVMASKWVGDSGHVYAFEIGPNEISLLKRNLAKNGVSNVTLLPYALSNITGKAKFALSQDGAMNSLAKTDHPHQHIEEWIEVDTMTLTDVAEKFGIDRVDVIKMDVEGAEKLVFEGGMDQLLRWKPKCILFESSELTVKAFGYTVASFVSYLIDNGFKVFSLKSEGLLYLDGESKYSISEYNFIAMLS